ncbi:MAG: cupredoxin domain-containing protein [candidate division NC10 bacterium]|nr:cupredoxin domain-containing protein [candidate division NC10 bacterium]
MPAAVAAGALLLLVAAFALPWGRPAAPIREVLLEARGVKWSGENPTITARVGERLKITVRNAESGPIPHDLHLVGPDTVTTHFLQPGEETTLTLLLDRPGRYVYACSLHPGLMDGVIEVMGR